MLAKKLLYVGLFSLLVGLSACSNETTSEQIYNHLEKAIELEQSFEEQQDKIVELEQEEQDIYQSIRDLGMEDFEEIKQLAGQALDNIETRQEKIDTEQESIDASREEFSAVEDKISKLDDDKAHKKGKDMYTVMMDRYDAYDKLNKAYSESLELEKELYKMLQKEDLEQDVLSKHIAKLNDRYEDVIEANETFNGLTAEYNELKKAFYQAAGLDVEYEKDAEEVDDTGDNGHDKQEKQTESDD